MQYDKTLRELLLYLNMVPGNYQVAMPQNNLTPHINMSSALANAEANGAEFKEYKLRQNEAERDLYQAKLQNSFNGDIGLSLGLNQYGDQLYLAYQKPSTQQSFLVNLRIPILDWGAQKNRYRIAKNRYEITTLNTENDEKNYLESVRAVVEQYNYNAQVLSLSKQQSELALKHFRLSVTLFENGKNTFFELVAARKQYNESERIYLEQLAQLWINYYTVRSFTLTDY